MKNTSPYRRPPGTGRQGADASVDAKKGISLVIVLEPDQVADLADQVADALNQRACCQCASSNKPGYLSVLEASALLRCRPQRIYDLVSQGRLRRFKDGSRVLIAEDDLHTHLRGESLGRVNQRSGAAFGASRGRSVQ